MRSALSCIIVLGLLAPVSIANAIPTGPCIHGELSSNSGVILACPKGDGPSLASSGLTISVRILDGYGNGVPGILKKDIWLVGDGLVGCPIGSGGPILVADAPTDADGRTTISGVPKAGGCSDGGLYVIVRVSDGVNYTNFVLGDQPGFECNPLSLSIEVRSPDMNGDGVVDVSDYNQFSDIYQHGPYQECADFNGDGTISLSDLAMFTSHYSQSNSHHCP